MMKSYSDDAERYPVCYVCGTPNCASSILYICQQSSPGKPFFPFLKNHEQPENSLPIENNQVVACGLCSESLHYQWKIHELNKVPLLKRLYWLKRDDGLPYSGVEVGMQTEYASQFLGLTPDPISVDERITYSVRSSKAFPTGTSESTHNIAVQSMPVNTIGKSNIRQQPLQVPAPKAVFIKEKVNPVHSLPKTNSSVATHINLRDIPPEPQQEALDLSVDRKRVRKRSPEVLDLSMPDKNATTEVCYVCGDHFTHGTLLEVYAKEQSRNCPFFPSLMSHARPSKSHPMEPSGCVRACKVCFDFLLSQYLFFNKNNVCHKSREYLLEKQSGQVDSNAVVCFECHVWVPNSTAKIVHYSMPECKPYLTDIEKRQSFTDFHSTAKISKIVCLDCFERRHSDASSDASNEQIDICDTSSPEVKRRKPDCPLQPSSNSLFSSSVTSLILGPDKVEESTVACYLCHQSHAENCMYWISMLPEFSGGIYFPFIKNIHRVSTGIVSEDGKVMVCSLCYNHLKQQWEEFEAKKISIDRRIFSCRAPSLDSVSPRQTPNMSPPYSSDAESSSAANWADINKNIEQEDLVKILRKYEIQPELDNNFTLPSVIDQNSIKCTVDCYLCGLRAKNGETYVVCSRNQRYSKMNFPFLAVHATPNQSASIGSGFYLVCTYCFHTLAQQWHDFENKNIEPCGRYYDTYNFTCYVCALKTYRKRLEKLHIDKFPFLREHPRPLAALVLHRGNTVAVCRDCYSRLQEQYYDMEKCGVPVERREYNWIKKPAPPQYLHQQPEAQHQGALGIGAVQSPAAVTGAGLGTVAVASKCTMGNVLPRLFPTAQVGASIVPVPSTEPSDVRMFSASTTCSSGISTAAATVDAPVSGHSASHSPECTQSGVGHACVIPSFGITPPHRHSPSSSSSSAYATRQPRKRGRTSKRGAAPAGSTSSSGAGTSRLFFATNTPPKTFSDFSTSQN